MRRMAEALFGKIKRNDLCNNSEDTGNNFDIKYCTQSSGRPSGKNTRLLDVSSGKGKSASKCNRYFCFISKNTASG